MNFTKEYEEAAFEETLIWHPRAFKLEGLHITDPRIETRPLSMPPRRFARAEDFPHKPVKTFQDE